MKQLFVLWKVQIVISDPSAHKSLCNGSLADCDYNIMLNKNNYTILNLKLRFEMKKKIKRTIIRYLSRPKNNY